MSSKKVKKGQVNSRNKKSSNKKNTKKVKKFNFKLLLKILAIIIVLVGIISFMLISPIFNIQNIVVTDNKIVSQETIISLSNITTGQNIFEFNKKDISNNIKQNAYIKEVEISRSLPSTVNIKITERQPEYCIEIVGKYAYIDNQGYVLEISENSNNMIILKGIETEESSILPNSRVGENDLEKLDDVIKIVNSAEQNGIKEKITSIDITDKQEYIIDMVTENKKIYFGDCSNLSEKMIYIIAILEKEIGKAGNIYVDGDFSKGFNPYFRENV